MNKVLPNSQLDNLIPGEIKNDEFYRIIQAIVKCEEVKTVLEIGSSSGEGSTEAFVTGLRENPGQPQLFCMEISKARFAELRDRYRQDSFVKCYNASSVSLEQFATAAEVAKFYKNTPSNLNAYSLQDVLNWRQQDVDYLENSGVSGNGIELIKQQNNIDFFDVVLIDGSEFTGEAELAEIYGATYILLDDINTYKNYRNHQKLLADPNYVLIQKNLNIRHGYSVFKKLEANAAFSSFNYELPEQFLIRNLVKPGMTVFDVGANIGNYAILLSKQVEESGKVYAFEPTSNTFARLQQRLEEYNCPNVAAFQKAVFSKDGQIEFNEFPDEYSEWNSIGKPQMRDPHAQEEYVPIAKSEAVEAIALDSFCEIHDVKFIDFLKVDVEGAESDVFQGAINLLRSQSIRFIQFEISKNMLEGLDRRAKDTFDILIEHGYECHRIEDNGDIGNQLADSDAFYENYIAFPTLPIHFFTIVLNGEPFIRHHIEVFKQLPFPWHWHIIEGVADLVDDSGWSLKLGGRISDEMHRDGRSSDGTTEYLDDLQKHYPDNISVYRKPPGVFWHGAKEMVNAPLPNIQEECLLWQVDVDELWTVEQIHSVRKLFISNPDKTAAYYWCWYFVGQDLVISSRYCYAQNPDQEWLRTWKYLPGYAWVSHSPPILAASLPDGQWQDVAKINPFLHHETEAKQALFQHYAYALPKQLQFKEQYYGYANALTQWNKLQQETRFPVRLRQYFPWVYDLTTVDRAEALGIAPIASRDQNSGTWQFFASEALQPQPQKPSPPSPTIVIDGVFFQLYKTGIARVWRSLLETWVESGFAKHLIVLDRAGTAPEIAGVRYYPVQAYSAKAIENDQEMLQEVCEQLGADLFISTYFTMPISTPSVAMVYDMIPEAMGEDWNHPIVQQKHQAIAHASNYIAISQNTADDIARFLPETLKAPVQVAHCGISSTFVPAAETAIEQFRRRYGINKPYFIVMSADNPSVYKNNQLFFQAFAKLPSKTGFELVCTAFEAALPADLREATAGTTVHLLKLTDEELAVAYAGAIALVYPSKYEGFGMPILEAMAAGCPVITCRNASIPEVAGEAALYVSDEDVDELANALCEVQKPTVRHALITAGLERAKQFSWSQMAKIVSTVLVETTLSSLPLRAVNVLVFVDWQQPEEALYEELGGAIAALLSQPKQDSILFLIDVSELPEELDLNLLLADLVMNFLMQEDLAIDEPGIFLLESLSSVQWDALAAKVHGYIGLGNQPQGAIAQATARQIPALGLDDLSNL